MSPAALPCADLPYAIAPIQLIAKDKSDAGNSVRHALCFDGLCLDGGLLCATMSRTVWMWSVRAVLAAAMFLSRAARMLRVWSVLCPLPNVRRNAVRAVRHNSLRELSSVRTMRQWAADKGQNLPAQRRAAGASGIVRGNGRTALLGRRDSLLSRRTRRILRSSLHRPQQAASISRYESSQKADSVKSGTYSMREPRP
jgi:hypothetical protein